MHSSSNVTWRARTSAAERGSVISGSGRTGPDRASYRHRRSYTGTHSVTATLRPEPFSPTPPGHALAGWGATPLALGDDEAQGAVHRGQRGHQLGVLTGRGRQRHGAVRAEPGPEYRTAASARRDHAAGGCAGTPDRSG